MILLCDFNSDYCFILIWMAPGTLFSEIEFFLIINNLLTSMLIKLNYSNHFMISPVIFVILDIVHAVTIVVMDKVTLARLDIVQWD